MKKNAIKVSLAFGIALTAAFILVQTAKQNRATALCKVPENPKFAYTAYASESEPQTTAPVQTEWQPDEKEAEMIAKVLYRECRHCSKEQQAAVVWVILNRTYRADFPGDTVAEVITAPHQFCYHANDPIEEDLLAMAKDVLIRHHNENCGMLEGEAVGRVIPSDYFWFTGDGKVNHFRNVYKSKSEWDWSLKSPYTE